LFAAVTIVVDSPSEEAEPPAGPASDAADQGNVREATVKDDEVKAKEKSFQPVLVGYLALFLLFDPWTECAAVSWRTVA
jgi:hypothetical protein